MREVARGNDTVVVCTGTGSDRRIVPPFADAGEEPTSARAATIIARRVMASPDEIKYPIRHVEKESGSSRLAALIWRKCRRYLIVQKRESNLQKVN
jgi:hypothetical protein